MQHIRQIPLAASGRAKRTLVPGVLSLAVAAVAGLIVLLAITGAFDDYPYLFLTPWILGLGIVMAIPSLYLYTRGRFSIADPIVFATLSYFLPVFVIGGLFFAGGFSQPPFLAAIGDIETTMPYTIVLVGLGFTGLAAGYLSPIGARAGMAVGTRLPDANYSANAFLIPGLFLLVLGVLSLIMAFTLGQFGYQLIDKTDSFNGLIFLSTMFWLQASALLWLIIFLQPQLRGAHILVISVLLVVSSVQILFSGSRGGLAHMLITIVLAYVLSGRRFGVKQAGIAAIVFLGAIFFGMIYGSTFRNLKGGEQRQSAGEYASNIFGTLDEVGRSDLNQTVAFGFSSLAERVDVLSTLAVVVANHEQLKPYEEAYGIDNNIWIESTTFFIPRVLWADKPAPSNPRQYSDLYFDFADSSFALTPIGDLLRNFGVLGIPLGMFILGVIIRFVYRSLIEGQRVSIWRINLFFMLLTAISYEGFYSTIVPNMFKVGVTAVVGILIVCFVARGTRHLRLA